MTNVIVARDGVRTPEMLALIIQDIAKSDHIPVEFVRDCQVFERERFLAPFYIANYSWDVHWTASFGYDRQEHYTEHVQRTRHDSRGGRHHYTEPVTRTRTVTDWRPASGRDTGSSYETASASDLPDAAMSILEGVSLEHHTVETGVGSLTPYLVSPWNGSGFNHQAEFMHSQGYSNVRPFTKLYRDVERVASSKMSANIDRSIRRYSQGDQSRGWSWSGALTTGEVVPAVAPIVRFGVVYEGREWTYWMDGTQLRHERVGSLPVDPAVGSAALMRYIPFGVAVFCSVLLLCFDQSWATWIGAAVVCGGFFLLGSVLASEVHDSHRNKVGAIASQRLS